MLKYVRILFDMLRDERYQKRVLNALLSRIELMLVNADAYIDHFSLMVSMQLGIAW